MKKIKVIEMGGTISAHGKNRLDLKDYQSGEYTGSDFLKAIPEIENVANVSFESFLQVSSTEVNADHWIQLQNKVTKCLLEENFDGVVITHGTNTLEETAYFLHLTVPSDKPIVFVGAQRPFTALSSDAHLNLLQAIRVAASDKAINRGVLVVLNDEISSAREVTKTNTYRLEAFQSGQVGYLGFIDPDQKVHFYRQPTKKHTIHSEFATLQFDKLDNVEIIYSYAGATGQLIEHLIEGGYYRGIVTAGTGAGLVSPSEIIALQKATKNGIFVVRSSRVGNGRVMAIDPYEKYHFISGDNLLPQKARILLMLCMLKYNKMDDIQAIFNEY
ncbi:asparaginase [Pseudogracilibacillus auburnensis]|uniref:asparaginase n=1 Tax=Pseudogracilibacillus auburnensis TaxID=1494959 RepID=UPI001A96EC0B|nr:asparaginase [Pseudogracilibacillus auburnensis]MBO1002877.1 asparaginase [Pseudogracilibacillus auburnensis]